ncbi:MAG: ABC transporter permease [Candidatus Thiodiazotropha sp. (ex Epidulcina cf. delphinae)]|nr:ABC transporter permease [Candidatus Thiodiazotropha sp. (ex Epidulcina cf. delphinae)]
MLIAIVRKELLLVFRDIHALMVLFLLPIVFILIMSLALQDRMGGDSKEHPGIGLWLESETSLDKEMVAIFTRLEGLRVERAASRQQLLRLLDEKRILAAITLPENFTTAIRSPITDDREKLHILYSASLPASMRRSILGAVREALGEYQANRLFEYYNLPDEQRRQRVDHLIGHSLVVTSYHTRNGRAEQPNSVQQSVPAWLIFSMFFVVIPISTTLLTEGQQGTLQRLRTIPVPGSYLLIGKLIPYLGVNVIQAVLMLLVGIHLVPLFSGEGLRLEGEVWLLIPLTLAVSLAAISFALLIAARARSTEQATTLGGIGNLILAAIGGIMVPTFVMPALMQKIAALSPMNWALEGFFAVLLRQGGWEMVWPEIFKLLLFAGSLFLLALHSYKGLTDRKQ